jgi:hypothetical protein
MMAEPPLDEVISLELRLLDPETRRDPAELDRLLHQDFTEIGASGKRWDRAATIASLPAEPGPAPEVRDIAAWRVDEGDAPIPVPRVVTADPDAAICDVPTPAAHTAAGPSPGPTV